MNTKTFGETLDLAYSVVEFKTENTYLKEQVKRLEERCKYLEEQNLALIRALTPPPPLPGKYRTDAPTSKIVACAVCNAKFDGPRGYVCNHPNCPTRVTC
jgi:hypothetical protein